MSDKGFIVVARSLLDNPVLKDPYYLRGFLWMVSEAAYSPYRKVVMSGRSRQVVELTRGQLCHGREFMARALDWTPQRIRTFLNHLKIEGLINLQTVDGHIVISICNYDSFQLIPKDANQQTNQQTNQPSTSDQPELQLKELKKEDIARSDLSFERWYQTFPKKVQSDAARRAYNRVLASNRISAADLQAKTEAFAEGWRRKPKSELQFCPYPAKWLNAGGFADDADPAAGLSPASPARDPSTFSDHDWKARLANFKARGEWSKVWGSAPGQPGCIVPRHLLVVSASGAA